MQNFGRIQNFGWRGRRLAPRLLTPLVAFVLAGGVAWAQTTYQIAITAPSNSPPTTGIVDYVFSAAGSDAATAMVTISSLSYSSDYTLDAGGYTLDAGADPGGGSTATVPNGPGGTTGTISNDPTNAQNGFSIGAHPFGKTLTFDVTFSGAALHPTMPYASSGSDFFVSLLDSSNNPIWTTDPMGRVLDININPDGTFGPGPYSLSSPPDGATVSVTPTPEPSSWAAMGAGAFLLLGLGTVRARKRGQSE